MKTHFSITFSFLNLTIINICLIWFNLSACFCQDAHDEFKACDIVYNCGELVDISYPFWGNKRKKFCGLQELKLTCLENKTTTIEIQSQEYNVLKINQSDQRMTIARSDLFNDYCPDTVIQTVTLNYGLFNYSSNARNISVWYDCKTQKEKIELFKRYRFRCEDNSEGENYVFDDETEKMNLTANNLECRIKIQVMVTVEDLEKEKENKTAMLEKALKNGIDVEYNINMNACGDCIETGGRCGSKETYPFYCICQNQNLHPYICTDKFPGPHIPIGILRHAIAGVASITSVGIIMIIIFICYRRKRKLNKKEIEKIIRSYATLTPKRYSYSKLKKITNSFKNKLGRGGFSIVYKGKLPDGRDVAVKLLNDSTENGQDFINEVVSISRTSHVNVVTLLGFCYEHNKRALIYEYMPKGSLDKYMSHNGLLDNNARLDWNTLHSIVIGIARGLEYLHCGCNTRIFHFDIKPHNILLDDDFCPKIADFGLAKQCKAKESHVTMTGAKGTVGFIAPEVIFRNFGRVSHKSDVYSYGMLIFEMVGERKNPNQRMSQSSEEYFPDWIYEDLTQTKDETSHWGNTEEEEGIARKMIIVGLNCIQTLPDERPSMTDVVSMLEGSLDCLQIPPKPTLFAPPMLPSDSQSCHNHQSSLLSALSFGERVASTK